MDAAQAALASFADPTMLLFLMLGVVAGLIVGVIPGLGGTAAVAILLPFVFVLEPAPAMALIIGAVAVVHHSDAIASILMGIPGSSSAAVLLLDGHEMAKQGDGSKALSIAFMSSMAGGLIGAVGLTLSIPIARPLVLLFGSPEIFMLTVLGISLTALLSKGNLLKGLIAVPSACCWDRSAWLRPRPSTGSRSTLCGSRKGSTSSPWHSPSSASPR